MTARSSFSHHAAGASRAPDSVRFAARDALSTRSRVNGPVRPSRPAFPTGLFPARNRPPRRTAGDALDPIREGSRTRALACRRAVPAGPIGAAVGGSDWKRPASAEAH